MTQQSRPFALLPITNDVRTFQIFYSNYIADIYWVVSIVGFYMVILFRIPRNQQMDP